MSHQSVLTTYIGAFVDELSRSGIEHVVVSPGSRSTPIAMMVAEHPKIKAWVNMDERSAGFFALGMAKAEQKPVALLCTSGTAVANYYPAIIEAFYSRIPLVVITADRPHELRDVGAPQAIDQIKIFGDYAKWFREMPLPSEDLTTIQHVRTVAGRSVAVATLEPSGPVHLNFPLQEPLIPDLGMHGLWDTGLNNLNKSYVHFVEGHLNLDAIDIDKLVNELTEVKRGLIVVGPQYDADLGEAVTKFAQKVGFPILADPLSQLRSGPHDKANIIDNYDSFLREDSVKKSLAPDLIIRIGAMPISKPFLLYLKQLTSVRHIVVEEGSGWREPTQLSTEMLYANPTLLCQALTDRIKKVSFEKKWEEQWREINSLTKDIIIKRIKQEEPFEGQVIPELQAILPDKGTFFLGNSMPIRDFDSFYFVNEKNHHALANRGANGIDGVVSTALGAAALSDEPVVLVIGDLSFYHDMNGLMAARLHALNLKIVVINNNGGGIFSFLPQATSAKHFEELFGTPTNIDFSLVAQMYNGHYHRVEDWQDFRQSMKRALSKSGLDIIEVSTNRQQNADIHRSIWEEVGERLRIEVNK